MDWHDAEEAAPDATPLLVRTRPRRASSQEVKGSQPVALSRRKSMSDSDIIRPRKLIEISLELSPAPSAVPRFKCELTASVASRPRRVQLTIERQMRTVVSIDARLIQLLVLFSLFTTVAGLSLTGAGGPARVHSPAARAAAVQRGGHPSGFVERVEDEGGWLVGEHADTTAALAHHTASTYPAPAGPVAAFEEATRHLQQANCPPACLRPPPLLPCPSPRSSTSPFSPRPL